MLRKVAGVVLILRPKFLAGHRSLLRVPGLFVGTGPGLLIGTFCGGDLRAGISREGVRTGGPKGALGGALGRVGFGGIICDGVKPSNDSKPSHTDRRQTQRCNDDNLISYFIQPASFKMLHDFCT
jgi:hypothetical protein